MKYLGSKARLCKYILPIILKGRTDETYVEPFAGGMNTICEVGGNRIAADIHYYLIEMWRELVDGWVPEKITREQYYHIKNNKDQYPPHLVGWVGFNCSYSGKWFAGFAGETRTKMGTTRDYQVEALNNVMQQVGKMEGVRLDNNPYNALNPPANSLIYCDPPYEGTTGYGIGFSHSEFWQWCREMSNNGHKVFVSEYNAPEDFTCVWSMEVVSSLSANGKSGGSKNSVEKLFTYDLPT